MIVITIFHFVGKDHIFLSYDIPVAEDENGRYPMYRNSYQSDLDLAAGKLPKARINGHSIMFEKYKNGYRAPITKVVPAQNISIEIPVGDPENPEIIPIQFSHQMIDFDSFNIGEDVIYTYDLHNLRVLDSNKKLIREYKDVNVNTQPDYYFDYESVQRTLNELVFFHSKDGNIYRVLNRDLIKITSVESIYGFGFDKNNNLYVFGGTEKNESILVIYKYAKPDYLLTEQIFININRPVNPYHYTSNCRYLVASEDGFFVTFTEYLKSQTQEKINKALFVKYNNFGNKVFTTVIPLPSTGAFEFYNETITGMDEDANKNIYCLSHVEAISFVPINAIIYIGSDEWWYDNYIEISNQDSPSVKTIVISNIYSAVYIVLAGLVEGHTLKLKLEIELDDGQGFIDANENQWTVRTGVWEDDGWRFYYNPEEANTLKFLGEFYPNIPIKYRFTYSFKAASAGEG